MKQREIKFRRKIKESYGGGWDYAEMNKEGYLHWKYAVQSHKKGTLGQYTGLKDKNGVEIYEGDVVEWRYLEKYIEKPDRKQTGEVMFKSGIFWVEVLEKNGLKGQLHELYRIANKNYELVSENCEVIGNIYENPELLK